MTDTIQDMRDWLNDCADCGIWADMEHGDFDADADIALTDREIVQAVQRHYDGGVTAFHQACA